MEVHDRLRKRADQLQLGPAEICSQLEISRTHYRSLIRGWDQPTPAVALAWLKLLKVDDNLRQDCYILWSRKARDEWENWNKVLHG